MKRQRLTSRRIRSLGTVAGVLVLSLGLSVCLWSRLQGDPSATLGEPAGGPSVICWGLVLVGIAGTALASSGGRIGWLLLFGLQPLWMAYALATGQAGLILGAAAYAVVQLNGFFRGTTTPPSQEVPCSGC